MNTNLSIKKLIAGLAIVILIIFVSATYYSVKNKDSIVVDENTALINESYSPRQEEKYSYTISPDVSIITIPFDLTEFDANLSMTYTSRIFLENKKEGTQIPLVTLKEGGKYLQVHEINPTQKLVYYSIERDGIGGYMILVGASNLYSVNYETGESKQLFKPSQSFVYTNFFDISSDGNLFTMWKTDIQKQTTELIVHDIRTGKETVLPTDTKAGFMISGRTLFSPDDKLIAYSSMVGDPEAEDEQISIVSILDNSQGVVPQRMLTQVNGDRLFVEKMNWLDSSTLQLSAQGLEYACTKEGTTVVCSEL